VRLAVVKLGGSTADQPMLRVWIDALAAASLPLVIVPGGGAFADQVREAQKRMGFSDEAAHAMAVLAMEQFGHVILDGQQGLVAAKSLEDMRQALAERKIPVWLPSSMALAAPDVPASWDITSDSLAAWLAGRLEAEALLLIKQSSAFSESDDVDSLMAKGIVDNGFATMLPEGIDLLVAGPGDAVVAGAALAAGRLPGVQISPAVPKRKVG
jgi:aspartokinase-like uncharacterized kinase